MGFANVRAGTQKAPRRSWVPARTLANPTARRAYSSTRLVPLFDIQKGTQGYSLVGKDGPARGVGEDLDLRRRVQGCAVHAVLGTAAQCGELHGSGVGGVVWRRAARVAGVEHVAEARGPEDGVA